MKRGGSNRDREPGSKRTGNDTGPTARELAHEGLPEAVLLIDRVVVGQTCPAASPAAALLAAQPRLLPRTALLFLTRSPLPHRACPVVAEARADFAVDPTRRRRGNQTVAYVICVRSGASSLCEGRFAVELLTSAPSFWYSSFSG